MVVDGDILGKPRDVAHAAEMLLRLAGREHTVYTAIAVARDQRTESAVEDVRVTMRALGEDEVAAYIATGEPMDKAGAYGIQGYGATIVERVDGDYFSVMGLGSAGWSSCWSGWGCGTSSAPVWWTSTRRRPSGRMPVRRSAA